MNYQVKDFDYNLPPELIAQEPAKPRDRSRLLLLDKKSGLINHRHFYDLPDYLQPGDLLVLNNSKVFPARLFGTRHGTGGRLEVFLHRQLDTLDVKKTTKNQINVWECLIKGAVKLGQVVDFANGLEGVILETKADRTRIISFNFNRRRFWALLNKIGEVPLPPYIKRLESKVSDQKNYQTVYASSRKTGSVAAPTAGLHFTTALLKKIRAAGVEVVYVTLHVGLGTFAPVKTDNIADHHMHQEFVEISAKTQRAILAARKRGGRIIAVGTTSCRTLESFDWGALASVKKLKRQSFWTGIFIYPGYRFKVVTALITNFHLPKSTLLMLVSALAGKNLIDKVYQEAIKRRYRFFSYGDALFIY